MIFHIDAMSQLILHIFTTKVHYLLHFFVYFFPYKIPFFINMTYTETYAKRPSGNINNCQRALVLVPTSDPAYALRPCRQSPDFLPPYPR